MYITWYGLSCLKIESKTKISELTIVTDPFDPKKTGLKLPRAFQANVVCQSRREEGVRDIMANPKEGEIFYIDSAGEFEKSGVFFNGIRINHEPHLIYNIEVEDLRVFYCGLLHRLPTEKEIENIESVDVLFVPVGGKGVLSSKDAAELVSELEPRVVIPTYYKLAGLKESLDGVEPFLKLMGAKTVEAVPKLRIVKKELPEEETRVLLLSPPY
jgi:L-ascorbate metabolism protein UlaG (beta-lactamase superfamily)